MVPLKVVGVTYVLYAKRFLRSCASCNKLYQDPDICVPPALNIVLSTSGGYLTLEHEHEHSDTNFSPKTCIYFKQLPNLTLGHFYPRTRYRGSISIIINVIRVCIEIIKFLKIEKNIISKYLSFHLL